MSCGVGLTPELWARTHNPWVVFGPFRSSGSGMLADPKFRGDSSISSNAARDAAQAADLVPANAFGFRSGTRRLLQHGIHVERGAANLCRRPGQCGRGSSQGSQRPRRARHRRGPAVSARLLPPGDRARWLPTGAVPLQRPRPAAHHAPARAGRRMAATRDPHARAIVSGCAPGRCKVGRLHLYLLDSNDLANYPAYRGITSELYGGGPSCGCSRKWCWVSAGGGCSSAGSQARGVPSRTRGMRLWPFWTERAPS